MAKRAKKKTAKRTTKRGTKKKKIMRRQKAAGPSIRSVDSTTLQRELQRRVRQLETQRESILAQLQDIDRELQALGGATRTIATGTAGRRHGNKQTLEGALASTLKGKTMGVSEAADAVVAAGYKTNAANLRTMVNQTLIKSNQIKRVSRGQYTAK